MDGEAIDKATYEQVEYPDDRVDDVLSCTTDTERQLVLGSSAAHGSDREVVDGSIAVVNALLDRLGSFEAVSDDAVRSYYADLYETTMLDGGFVRYLKVSGWRQDVTDAVLQGLQLMGADAHVSALREAIAGFEAQTPRTRRLLVEQGNDEVFAASDAQFTAAQEGEPVVVANARWLREHPALHVVGDASLDTALDIIVGAAPEPAPGEGDEILRWKD